MMIEKNWIGKQPNPEGGDIVFFAGFNLSLFFYFTPSGFSGLSASLHATILSSLWD